MSAYKIKDLETLTGIKAHTIRIWEKRYGLITPNRTKTQIRTYTNEELVHLINISLLNKNGVKISTIVNLKPEEINQRVWDFSIKTSLDNSAEKLILALVRLDEMLFNNTLQQVIDSKGMQQMFTDYLIPFLDRIGVMWLVGTISIAQEHFISNLIRQKLISEIDKLTVPQTDMSPVMLFLPEHEWHEISLLFYQYYLRSKGIPTIYLGQSLPYDSLISCIEQLKPKALVTSWLMAVKQKFIINYFKQLHTDLKTIPVYAGGIQIKQNKEQLTYFLKEITKPSDFDDLIIES